jgi:hypothetical protein
MTSKLSLQERTLRLRDLMRNATDLSEPVNYFMANLAHDRKFLRQSKIGNPGLGPILDTITRRVFGPAIPATLMKFRRYGKLWHGGGVVGVHPLVVMHPLVAIYHTEIDIGIFSVHTGSRFERTRFTMRGNSPVSDEHGTDTDDLS